MVEQQLVKGNPLGVAGTEGGNDVRSLAESRGSIKNLFKSMAFVDLVQEEDGWVQLAESWRKATRNDDIIQKGQDGKKGSQRVREDTGVLLTAGFSWLGQFASISEHSVTR